MNTQNHVVLVVDDEATTRKLVAMNLEARGFTVLLARNGIEALRRFSSNSVDLVVLDLNIPAPNGFDVCTRIRAESDVPILVLTASANPDSKTMALMSGADDYIAKPFGIAELLDRVDSSLQRGQRREVTAEIIYKSGSLLIDLTSRQVTRAGHDFVLTPTEYRLLRLFIHHEGEVLTNRAILRNVWGPSSSNNSGYVHSYVRKLRRKIETNPGHPVHIINETGTGYGFFG